MLLVKILFLHAYLVRVILVVWVRSTDVVPAAATSLSEEGTYTAFAKGVAVPPIMALT